MQARLTYAEAKEIALLRLELRLCWDLGDHAGAIAALGRLSARAGNYDELTAEFLRWWGRLAI